MAFVDIARGVAALLVVYTHIVNVFLQDFEGVRTKPTDVVNSVLVAPLRLNEQGIGGVSVPVFFLVSGFVVTPVVLKMGAWRFAVNRLLRIYPTLLAVVALSAVLLAFGQSPLSTNPQHVGIGSFLSNASLWNFFDRPLGAWVGPAWTLAVEVLFYATLVALLPLLRTRVWLAIGLQLWLVLMLLITHRALGAEYRALVINMTYTLIAVMGLVIWTAWTHRVPARLAAGYLVIAWLLFVWAADLRIDPQFVPRPFPVALALLLFLLGLFAEPYLRPHPFWTALSERTFSIYLVHGAVAFPVLHVLFGRVPLGLAVLAAVAATAAVSELTYRFVERPSHALARRLSRRRATPGAVAG